MSWNTEPCDKGIKYWRRNKPAVSQKNKSDDTNLENIPISPTSNFLDQIEDFVGVASRNIRSQWCTHYAFVSLTRQPIHWKLHGQFYTEIQEHSPRFILRNSPRILRRKDVRGLSWWHPLRRDPTTYPQHSCSHERFLTLYRPIPKIKRLVKFSYDKKSTYFVTERKRPGLSANDDEICSSAGQMSSFASKSDRIYRRFILSSFFSKGWGDVRVYERLLEARKLISDRTKCSDLISPHYPIELTKSWTKDACHIADGHFTSPLAHHFPGLLPKESEKAYFQVIIPKKWPQQGRKPLCLHLAGTGDHHFWRRRNLMAKPLAKEYGIASVLLENPFYGMRKPNNQVRSSLRHVVDLFIMGAALILESLVLLHWCDRQEYGPLGITGISMGGHMASLACTAWPKPLAIVPCLSWSTASCVFTQVD